MFQRRWVTTLCTMTLLTAVTTHINGLDEESFEHYDKAAVAVRGISAAAEEAFRGQHDQLNEEEPRGRREKRAAFWHTTYGGARHKVEQVRVKSGENVRLEDGSTWSVHEDDRYSLAEWRRDDIVTIIPHRTFIFKSNYLFYLVNQRTSGSVRSNIVEGPTIGMHHCITLIDYEKQIIVLSDKSVWKLSDSDLLKDWLLEDVVLIGTNDSWFSSYSHIIININTDPVTYMKASCYY